MYKSITKSAVIAVALAGIISLAGVAHAGPPQTGDKSVGSGFNSNSLSVQYGYWVSPRNQFAAGVSYGESESKVMSTFTDGSKIVTKSDTKSTGLGVAWKGLFAVRETGAGFVTLGYTYNKMSGSGSCDKSTYDYTAGGGYSFFVNESVTINVGIRHLETNGFGCNDGILADIDTQSTAPLFGIEYNF